MADLKTFGVVLFEGFELLDVFGPLEAFGILANANGCRVLTVAQSAGAITSAQGPKAIADFSFRDCPRIDIMLVPGGMGTRREVSNHALLEWLGEPRAAGGDRDLGVHGGRAAGESRTARRTARDDQ